MHVAAAIVSPLWEKRMSITPDVARDSRGTDFMGNLTIWPWFEVKTKC